MFRQMYNFLVCFFGLACKHFKLAACLHTFKIYMIAAAVDMANHKLIRLFILHLIGQNE